MSMIFWIVAVTPDQIIKLHKTPSLANDLLTVARAEGRERQRRETLKRLPPERRQQAEARFREMHTTPHFVEAEKEVEHARERTNHLASSHQLSISKNHGTFFTMFLPEALVPLDLPATR